MSEQRTFRCDICKVEKKETNHWWKGYLIAGDEAHKFNAGIMVLPWDLPSQLSTDDNPMPPDVMATEKHLCGEQHVAEWVSQNLGVMNVVVMKAPREASSEIPS